MEDVLIIGGGPAALAASVYLARQKMKFALITKDIGGQTLLSSDVENYLGFHLLDGVELVKKFREHLADYRDQFTMAEGEEVAKLERLDSGGFRATTASKTYDGKTVLIATGTIHRQLGVPGEKELYGRGVTYCATCDAPLFRDKTVCIVGGGNSAMDAALFTAKYATKVVIVTVNPELRGDDVMQAKIASDPKISVVVSAKSVGIEGKEKVTGLRYAGSDGKEQVAPCDGVFIEIGLMPVSGFVDFVAKDKWSQIVVDKANATNVEGVWAAGDVTDVTEKQVAVAVGEGSKASLSIIKYFQTHHA